MKTDSTPDVRWAFSYTNNPDSFDNLKVRNTKEEAIQAAQKKYKTISHVYVAIITPYQIKSNIDMESLLRGIELEADKVHLPHSMSYIKEEYKEAYKEDLHHQIDKLINEYLLKKSIFCFNGTLTEIEKVPNVLYSKGG